MELRKSLCNCGVIHRWVKLPDHRESTEIFLICDEPETYEFKVTTIKVDHMLSLCLPNAF